MKKKAYSKPKLNVCIAGLAACGKSTQVDLLGKYFDLRIVHTSRLFREMQKMETHSNDFWEKKGISFTKERMQDLSMDRKLDAKLLKIARKGKAIFDSWTLPWLLKENQCFSVYLKASQEVRAKRIAERDKIGFEKALKLIKERDSDNIKLYYNLYNYRVDKDLNKFDLVLNTNELGIKEVYNILKVAIKSYFKERI